MPGGPQHGHEEVPGQRLAGRVERDASAARRPGRVVVVRAGASDHYRLELIGTCPDVDWAWRIALRTRGSSWVCRGYDAELVVPHPSGTQYCPVRAVRKLSEAEVEAFRTQAYNNMNELLSSILPKLKKLAESGA